MGGARVPRSGPPIRCRETVLLKSIGVALEAVGVDELVMVLSAEDVDDGTAGAQRGLRALPAVWHLLLPCREAAEEGKG